MSDTAERAARMAEDKLAKVEVADARFTLVAFDQLELTTEPAHLIKGVIPRHGLSVVWGPPKSGKSYWTFDAMLHVALGWEYHGRRVIQGPVVYVACEGGGGLRARAEAFRQEKLSEVRDEPVPLYVVADGLDLISDHQALTDSIHQQLDGAAPAAVVLDTLNRSLRGSESSDEDMTAYIRAADAIRAAFDCAIIIVHHCGIEGTRPRGHTSLAGAVDAQIAVSKSRDGANTVRVETMRDSEAGAEIHCRLRQVEIGVDDAGDPITSCVVEPDEAPAATETGIRLTPNQRTMLSFLEDAGSAGLTVEEWNAAARAEGIGAKRKADLRDLRVALKRKDSVYEYAGRWHIVKR